MRYYSKKLNLSVNNNYINIWLQKQFFAYSKDYYTKNIHNISAYDYAINSIHNYFGKFHLKK